MNRSIRRYTRLILILCLSIALALHVHADQWKMNKKGNSRAANQRKSGYRNKKIKLDRSRRSVNPRTEYDLETGWGARRLSSGPQDACTQWCGIFYFCFSLHFSLIIPCPALFFDSLCYKRKEKWYLDCSLAEIDAIPTGIPVNTSRMWLSGQGLTDIGVTNFLPPLPRLRELLLNGNPITNISATAFQNVTGLKMLLLHYTSIPILPVGVFDNMRKLRYLWVNNAEVTTIEDGNIFSDLIKLEELRLSGNNISSFHSGQFKALPAIRELKLMDNNADLFSGDLASSCCALCGVKQDSVEMNHFKNISALDDSRRLICDYSNLNCKDSSNQDINCGEGQYSYLVSSASNLHSLLRGIMTLILSLIASYHLTLE